MIERTCPDCSGLGTYTRITGDANGEIWEQETCGCSNGTISVCEDDTPIPYVKKKREIKTIAIVVKEMMKK